MNIKRSIPFPKELYELAEKKAQSLGLTFEEYLTQLLEKELDAGKNLVKTKAKNKYFFAKDEEEIRSGF